MDLNSILNKAITDLKSENSKEVVTEGIGSFLGKLGGGAGEKAAAAAGDANKWGFLGGSGPKTIGVAAPETPGTLDPTIMGNLKSAFQSAPGAVLSFLKRRGLIPQTAMPSTLDDVSKLVTNPTGYADAARELAGTNLGRGVGAAAGAGALGYGLGGVDNSDPSMLDQLKSAGSDVQDWASENPGTATALGVGIPAALLAGAGALALRRRQLAARGK